MTVVTEYTDMDGIFKINSVAEPKPVEFGVEWTRTDSEYAIVGEWGFRNIPGLLRVDGITITRVLDDGDYASLMLNSTPATGTAAVLKAATVIAADTVVVPTSTDAKDGLVSATLGTSAVTTEGYLIYYGTDPAGNKIVEAVHVPTTLAIGGKVTTKRVFHTVTHIAIVDIVSTGSGTLTYASEAGVTTVVPGPAADFELIGTVEQSTNNIIYTFPHCYAVKGGKLGWKAGQNGKLDDPMTCKPRKVAECTMSWVNA